MYNIRVGRGDGKQTEEVLQMGSSKKEEKGINILEITTLEELCRFNKSNPSDVELGIAADLQTAASDIEKLKKGLMNRIDQLEVELNRAAKWIDVGLGDPNQPTVGGHGINYSLVREIDLGCTELVVKVVAYGSVKAMAKLALTSGDKEE